MKPLILVLSTFFIASMFISFFGFPSAIEHFEGSNDCLFSSHEEALCPIQSADLVGKWKTLSIAIVKPILQLMTIAGAAVIITTIPTKKFLANLSLHVVKVRWLKERTYTFTPRTLQALFSRGILHSKLH